RRNRWARCRTYHKMARRRAHAAIRRCRLRGNRRPSSMTIQLVVFDIDDTLYLERDYVRSGFLAVGDWVRANLGVEGFSEVAWQLFEEGLRNVIFDRTLEILGISPSDHTVRTLVDVYRHHRPTISLADDARGALDHLGGLVPIAVVTDG